MRGSVFLIFLMIAVISVAPTSGLRAAPAKEIDRYYVVTVSGKRVGYDHFQRVRLPGGGYRSLADSYVNMTMFAPSQEVSIKAVGEFGRDGKTPLSYALTMVRNGIETTLHCRFQGRKAIWDTKTNGQSNHGDITLPAGTVTIIDNLCWIDLIKKSAGRGRFRVMTFSPYLGQLRDVTVWKRGIHTETVAGKPTRCMLWETTMPTIFAPVAVTLSIQQGAADVVALRAPIMKLEYVMTDRESVKDYLERTVSPAPVAAPSTP
jgi:hypothetical protein